MVLLRARVRASHLILSFLSPLPVLTQTSYVHLRTICRSSAPNLAKTYSSLPSPPATASLSRTPTTLPPASSDFAVLRADVRTRRNKMEGPALSEDGKVLLKSMTLDELTSWIVDEVGEKKYRAQQIWGWMYKRKRFASTFDEMLDLPTDMRARLNEMAKVDSIALDGVKEARDGTKKLIFRVHGGGVVESVVIPARGRTTLCISSQVGCALNCQFCFTGKMGFGGHLNVAEIVDQVVIAKRHFESEGNIISNVVFMGEGEPLHNVNNVIRAVNDILLSNQGLELSHNKVTVSTSGLVPEMRRFLRESKANLAVSLHACTNEVRSWLMPINRKYPLEEVLLCLKEEIPKRNLRKSKVFFEYIMLKGINDSLQDAKNFLRLTARIPSKINLIRFNAHEGSEFQSSDDETIFAFLDYLAGKNVVATLRESRGDDGMMACGQLGRLGPTPSPRMRVPERFIDTLKTGSECNSDRRQAVSRACF